MSKELRIGVVGNVDSGKSTFVGVFKNKELDDGRGLARKGILQCKHELNSGRTSTITQQYIKINGDSSKSLVFIDLAGHEKYLKTTLHGLTGYFLDHVFVMVGANMGVSRMTREHLSIVLALNIPFSIIITKVDICPKNILVNTIKSVNKMIKRMCKRRNINKTSLLLKYNDNIEKIYTKDLENKNNNIYIFCISNKTGVNFNLVRDFCNILIKKNINLYKNSEDKNLKDKNLEDYKKEITEDKKDKLFVIDNKYNVPGVGIVVAGRVFSGRLVKNEQLFIGPFNGEWYKISIKSFHDNFRNSIDKLEFNEAGTVAIKFIDIKKDIIKKLVFKRGIYILSKNGLDKLHYKLFDAEVKILVNHSTTIKENYQPIINCNKIVQAARIEEIYNKGVLRAGDVSKIRLRFNFRSEFIRINDIFIFREGKTKGIGRIVKLYNT